MAKQKVNKINTIKNDRSSVPLPGLKRIPRKTNYQPDNLQLVSPSEDMRPSESP
jgi:hypothetical protein